MANTNVFIDTNILVYAYLDNEKEKHNSALFLLTHQLLGKYVFISIQVINEFYITMEKYKIPHTEIVAKLTDIAKSMNVITLNFAIVERCFKIKEKYAYAWWDSLILASALENNCGLVYSEDMQHTQVIEKTLTLVNPFFSA
jgi:predicted nucleic acid-binding protein